MTITSQILRLESVMLCFSVPVMESSFAPGIENALIVAQLEMLCIGIVVAATVKEKTNSTMVRRVESMVMVSENPNEVVI